ncbi:MAG: fused response regulator/phosphatase [Defluviimonas denitrificans]
MTDSPESDPAPPAPDAAAPTARRVMVVDDSRVQRKILTTQLARAGYQVTEAASVEEALPLCAESAPDIVISDWVMPGLSGLDFCRALRAQKHESYTYFILLTSKTETAEIAHGLDGGADDFLTKPVTGDELRARIAAGDRIIRMERELTDNNRLLTEALTELRLINDSVNRDLVEARKLQQSLVRERFRKFGPVQVSLLLQPSGHIGGDLVGFFAIDAARVGVYALDVSGHGITSALMTARLAGYLSGGSPDHNIALQPVAGGGYRGRDPADIAAHLNRIVLTEMGTESYFTLAYAEIDITSGRTRLVQAGHPHPVVQRADGRTELLGRGGMPVGLFFQAKYEGFETVLAPGDRLLLVSDGVTEVEDREGRQLGEDGLDRLMRGLSALQGPEFLQGLVDRLTDRDGADFADDVSAALIERS